MTVAAAARLTEVSRRYGRRWALVRVSLEVPEGATVLLTGPNGAGKTTLLRILATSLAPTHGAVQILGLEARDEAEAIRSHVGLVTHQIHVYEDMSPKEALQLIARLDRHVDQARIPQVLERVGLAARATSSARTFSAGMRRRLCLARMLIREPELILLDEPFTQLDPEGVALVEEVIREQRRRGATIVMSTHDVERGRALCDWHLHMVAGRPAAPLTPLAGARCA